MALNWDAKKVKDIEKVDRAVLDNIIFGTMFVGIYEITEKNYKEFYARYHFIEKLNGSFLNNRYITEDEIKQLIGLRTNASRKSRSAFIKQYTDRFFKDLV